MTIDQTIINAVSTIVSAVSPNVYQGTATEYVTFNYSETQEYAESTSYAHRYSVQVHLFGKLTKNLNTTKRQIAYALNEAGFTYPSIVNATDGENQHHVFECLYAEAYSNATD